MMKLNLRIPSLILLNIVLIGAFSCKKDTEFDKLSQDNPNISGVTQTGSEASRNSTTQINEDGIAIISDKDSLSDIPTAFSVTNEGKYKYKLVLKQGNVYALNTKDVEVSTQTFRGKSQTQTQTSIENVEFKVLQAQNGFYKMQATFKGSKMIISSDGQTVSIDPTQAKPSNPILQPGWMIQKARNGKVINFQMDEKGNISNITGFDVLLSAIRQQVSTELKGEELESFMQQMSNNINAESFKNQIEKGFIKFPKNGIQIGESWSDQQGDMGKLTFTLSSIENGKAHIKVASNFPTKSNSKTIDGITGKASLSTSSNGEVFLSTESGWITNAKLIDKISQSETYSRGTETQTQSIKSVSTTTIN